MYIVQWLYNVQSWPYIVQCTMYNVHHTYTVQHICSSSTGSRRKHAYVQSLCSFTLPLRCIAINANKYIIIKIYYVILTHGRVEYISAKESQAFSFFVNFFHCGRKSARSMKSIYRWYCMKYYFVGVYIAYTLDTLYHSIEF